MKVNNIVLICKAFHYSTSGIQTYIEKVVSYYKNRSFSVVCSLSGNIEINSNDVIISKVEKPDKQSFVSNLYIMIKILFSNRKNLLLSIHLFYLLLINRNALINSNTRLKEMIGLIENGEIPIYTISSVVMPEGLIGLIVKMKYSVPCVIMLQGSELIHFSGSIRQKWLFKFIFKNADIIVANSEYMKHQLKLFVTKTNDVLVNYLGVDTDDFTPNEFNIDLAKQLNISRDKKIILSVSNLVYRKGIDILLKALAIVKEDYKDFVYLAIGGHATNEYKNSLESIVDKYGLNDCVIWVGAVAYKELNPYYNLCDFFILPARDEAFGLVTFEANACGKTVIGSATDGIKETIIDKKTGLLFESENERDLADKILILLKDGELTERLSINAYERVISDYSWEMVVNRLQNQIEQRLSELKN